MRISGRFLVPAVLCAMAIAAADAGAFPLLSRKYSVPCVTCHTGDFKLNDFGAAVDINGHQLPGTVERTPVWNQGHTPFSLLLQQRSSMTMSQFDRGNIPDSTVKSINSAVMSILAGGVIAPHVSLMTELDFELTGQELLAALEYAFVNFNNIFNTDRGEFNIRFGKMRMETLFEQTPEFYMSKYLIYEYPLLISSRPQQFFFSFPWYAIGGNAELSFLPTAPQLTVAYSIGDVGDLNTTAASLLYGRLSTDFNAGPVPMTLGVSTVLGQQTIDPVLKDSLVNDATHIGLDWKITQPYGGPLTMYGHIMKFHQTDVLKAAGTQADDMLGGFVELTGVIVPEKVTCQVRYDFTNRTTEQPRAAAGDPLSTRNVNTTQYTVVGRYHFMPNFHLFLEGNVQNTETYLSGGPVANAPAVTRSAFYISGGFFLGL